MSVRVLGRDGDVLFQCPSDRAPQDSKTHVNSPLILSGHEVGRLEVWPLDSTRPERAKALLQALKHLLEDRLQNEYEIESLSAELAERYEEIHLLYQITDSLGAVFDVARVCQIALEFALKAIPANRASVLVFDEKEGVLKIAAQKGIPDDVLQSVKIQPGEGICGWVFEQGQSLLVEDLDRVEHLRRRKSPEQHYETNSFLSVPLVATPLQVKGRKLGVINLADRVDGRPFTTSDLKTLSTIASVTAIALYNCRLVDEVKAAEAVQKELQIAKNIQQSLLPKTLPRIPGADIACYYQLARTVGGDYYDFYRDETNLLSIVVADVSGHDIGAALMMVEARSVIRSEVSRWRDPAEVLHGTNRVLYDDLEPGGLFVSAFCARLDPTTWTLEYANAGHCLPIWIEGRSGQKRRLDADGMLIGIWPEVNYEKREVQLREGDVVFFFTDGVSEAKSSSGDQFGEERVADILARNRSRSAQEIIEAIKKALVDFTENGEFADDITMVVLKRC